LRISASAAEVRESVLTTARRRDTVLIEHAETEDLATGRRTTLIRHLPDHAAMLEGC
jgi:hypothetical protein